MIYENLSRVAMNELKKLDTAYASKEEFSPEDAKKYDCLMHAWKSQLTAESTYEATHGEYAEEPGMSGRRMRNPMNGRYMSGEPRADMSYADGYSRGYSEAMSQNQSGYPYMNRPTHY